MTSAPMGPCTTGRSLTSGDEGIRLSLREWIHSGLMTFFFLVTGLETRRELSRPVEHWD